MRKILLGLIIIMAYLSNEGYACNNKLLDSEAESWVSKTWSNVSFNENQIRESLIFLDTSNNPSKVYKTYLEEKNFTQLYSKIQDSRLSRFVDLCKHIYQEDDIFKKISVFMLLQTVSDKYESILRKAESLKPLNTKEHDNNTGTSSSNLLDIFLNADKNIRVK